MTKLGIITAYRMWIDEQNDRGIIPQAKQILPTDKNTRQD